MSKTLGIFIICVSFFLLSCNGKGNTKPVSDTETAEVIEDEYDDEHGEYLVDVPIEHRYVFKGKVGNQYEFVMEFAVDSFSVNGNYKYLNKKEGMSLNGKLQNNQLTLTESYYDSKNKKDIDTGTFEGILFLSEGTVRGTWFSTDRSKSHPFEMKNYYGANYSGHTFKSDIRGADLTKELNTLVVYDKDGNEVQRFHDIDAQPTYNGITLIDMNFDGYLDIAQMNFVRGHDAAYIYWVYNPDTKQYETFDFDWAYDNLTFDYEKKTIECPWHKGSQNFGNEIYKLIGKELYKIESHQYTEDEENETSGSSTTYYKVIDGESIPSTMEETNSESGNIKKRYKRVGDKWVEISK